MIKNEILKRFKAGFEVGDDPYQDNLLVDIDHTKDNELRLWAYDACMFPLPEFKTWGSSYKRQVIKEVLGDRRVKETNLDIYIDGTQIRERDADDPV